MKIDQLGCVVMEKDGMPGDLGDSCAETGRYVILKNDDHDVNLLAFMPAYGFFRHPNVPPAWGPADFTSDQGNYLMMASRLVALTYFCIVRDRVKARGWRWAIGGHRLMIDSICIANQWWNLLGVCALVQMLFNAFPIRWSDAHDRTGVWNYWRFTWSNDSTISFVTVFVTMVFLKRVGVTWPSKFFNREKYLAKVKSYYANQPNSDWFIQLFEKAET